MFEDGDLWPFSCPQCGEEFVVQIGKLKSGKMPRCAWCQARLPITVEMFTAALAKARAGEFNPWAPMTRIRPVA